MYKKSFIKGKKRNLSIGTHFFPQERDIPDKKIEIALILRLFFIQNTELERYYFGSENC